MRDEQESTATASTAEAVTPHNSTNFTTPADRLYVGTGGDVTLIPAGQTAPVIYANVPDGSYLWVKCTRVNATGTDADDIVAERTLRPSTA